MNDNAISISESQSVKSLFGKIGNKNNPIVKKIMMKGLRRGAGLICRDTRQLMKSGLGASAIKTSERNPTPMTEGLRVKGYDDSLLVKVNILGDYRLKWFEAGTNERRLKKSGVIDRTKKLKRGYARKSTENKLYQKGNSRGRIKPHYFFNNSIDEMQLMKIISDSINKDIQNIVK